MKNSSELRKILSKNIKKARADLHITQAKLAVYSGISVPHMIEIEQCKTWVSDRTLSSIAKALNVDVYQLLVPETSEKTVEREQKGEAMSRMADLIKAKKRELRKSADEAMDGLVLEIAGMGRK